MTDREKAIDYYDSLRTTAGVREYAQCGHLGRARRASVRGLFSDRHRQEWADEFLTRLVPPRRELPDNFRVDPQWYIVRNGIRRYDDINDVMNWTTST